MPDLYTDPSDEDIAEFGSDCIKAAWDNLCWFYTQQGSLTGAGEL